MQGQQRRRRLKGARQKVQLATTALPDISLLYCRLMVLLELFLTNLNIWTLKESGCSSVHSPQLALSHM